MTAAGNTVAGSTGVASTTAGSPVAGGSGAAGLGPAERERSLRWLAANPVDVAVIGGGITGVGCALDAAARGLSVALVEQRDLASGTSSRSSKLIHGGLRYLEQWRFGLVAGALAERTLLANRLAPHLVRPVPFLFPLAAGPTAGVGGTAAGSSSLRLALAQRAYVGAGVGMYSAMAHVSELAGRLRSGGGSGRGQRLARHRHLSARAVAQLVPALRSDAQRGGVLYLDGSVDDARFTVAVARTAAAHGAHVLTSVRVTKLHQHDGQVTGIGCVDVETGATVNVRAKAVINASGVWTDDVDALAPSLRNKVSPLRVSKGVHVVLPASRLRLRTGLIVPTAQSVLLAVPWGHSDQYVIVGTTDTPYSLSRAHPAATADDIGYLLGELNRMLVKPVTPDDVCGVYAGLRPLVGDHDADTSQLSRSHHVEQPAPGLVSVKGGKFTTYRVMAADAVDAAVAEIARQGELQLGAMSASGVPGTSSPSGALCVGSSPTRHTVLVGSTGYDRFSNTSLAEQLAVDLGVAGIGAPQVAHLIARHGDQTPQLLELVASDAALAEPLADGYPYLAAEVAYAVRSEAALHLDDVLTRRTRLSVESQDRALGAAQAVSKLMASELSWTDAQRTEEVERYAARISAERASQAVATDELADAARRTAPDARRRSPAASPAGQVRV